MCNADVIRAWKDEEYRLSLSADERAMLPANPAGAIELSDAEVGLIAGGVGGRVAHTYVLCTSEAVC